MVRYLETRDIFQVSRELGHTSVRVTEKYRRFSLRKLEQDFPSLANGYNDQNTIKTVIRDTLSRDTIRKNTRVLEKRFLN
jgi:hypothetical protein